MSTANIPADRPATETYLLPAATRGHNVSVFHRRDQHAATAPEVRRTVRGSVIWPDDTDDAFYQLCDLARVPPDHPYPPAVITRRLHDHGEATKRSTVEKIMEASARGWEHWREPPLLPTGLSIRDVAHLAELLGSAIDGGVFDRRPGVRWEARDVRQHLKDILDAGGW